MLKLNSHQLSLSRVCDLCVRLYLRSLSHTMCSFLLRMLTHKRFRANLAMTPTCDTVSTYHITDNARDPQRGLSRATYLLKVSRRAAQPNEEVS